MMNYFPGREEKQEDESLKENDQSMRTDMPGRDRDEHMREMDRKEQDTSKNGKKDDKR